MGDTRIAEFTGWYHEEYEKKYKRPYFWKGGKEQNLMKKALSYFEKIFGEDGALSQMKAACGSFLATEDRFLAGRREHDLSDFLTNPHKWLPKVEERGPHASTMPPESKKVHEPISVSDDKLIEAIIACGPEKFAKGWFSTTRRLMLKINPGEYERYKRVLMDLLGKERMMKLYDQVSEVTTAIPQL